MKKYNVSTKLKCVKTIKLLTDDKSNLIELKSELITQAFLHNRTCKKCAEVSIYEEDIRKANSIWKVKSIAKCGKVISIEDVNPTEITKKYLDKDEEKLRIEKINNINHNTIR